MTLEDLEALDREMLTPADVAPILGYNPQTIRTAAREAPWQLKFPFVMIGSRMKIPKTAFVAWMRGRES